MTSIAPSRVCDFLFAVAMCMTICFTAQAQDNQLKRLRADYAMRFLEPEPHMALAKYFFDRGDRLQAFYIGRLHI
jgi:hypothetical protein